MMALGQQSIMPLISSSRSPRMQEIVEQINGYEADLQGLSDSTLAGNTDKFKERLANGETLDDILPEAFAVVREASRRVLGMLGQVRVQELTLKGRNVGVDLSNLDAKDGSAVRRADSLELTGVITADNLADLLKRKVDKVQDIQVTITPQAVTATGKVKIAGRQADIHLEGVLFDDDGSVYFRMIGISYDPKIDRFLEYIGEKAVGDLQKISLEELMGEVRCKWNDKAAFKARNAELLAKLRVLAVRNAELAFGLIQDKME